MKTLKLDIRGMTCGSCVRSVHRALSSIPDLNIKHLDRSGALVEVDDGVSADELVDVVRGAGFDATVVVAPLRPTPEAQAATPTSSTAGATGCGGGCGCASR